MSSGRSRLEIECSNLTFGKRILRYILLEPDEQGWVCNGQVLEYLSGQGSDYRLGSLPQGVRVDARDI